MSAVPKVSKVAMKHIISSVNIHNRMVEEDECWRQRRLEISREERRSVAARDRPVVRKWRAHMDEEAEVIPQTYQGRETCNWTKLYDKIESTCPDRWGHAGYKELYPEQFLSTDEENENKLNSTEKNSRLRRGKRKPESSDAEESDEDNPTPKKRRKMHDNESQKNKRMKKKSKKSKRSPSSPPSSLSSSPERLKKVKRKKSKKSLKKKS